MTQQEQELVNTLYQYGGGAIDLTKTVMDTADVVTGDGWEFRVSQIVAYIGKLDYTIYPAQVVMVCNQAVKMGVLLRMECGPDIDGRYRWVE